MKKYLILAMFFVLAAALISPVSVSAATKAGVKSGSFFYFFDKAFERADLFFTFSPEKKAKKALENADERLAEAEESASENKPEAVVVAMENYQEDISLAETEAKSIKDETKTKDLLSTIASSTSKHQEILMEVLAKVPEEAKEAIEKAIETSKKWQEEAMKEAGELEKGVSEITQEPEEIKNKEEQTKSNDDKEDNKKNESKKDEQKKEIEKLKKEIESLKQKQPQIKIIEKIIEKPVIIEKKESSSSQTNSQEKQTSDTKDIIALPQQPRLVRYQDNFGNIYTEEKDFIRKAGEDFNHGFGASYIPLCMRISTTEDCQLEIVKWVNNRSIEIGKSLNVTLDSFDANDDSVFYYITYGSHKDWSYGNMRVLQSWETNKNFNIPITEQLYNETLSENLGWSSTFFDKESRKYYQKNVKLDNAGKLNIQVCFNDKAQKIDYPLGEQFTDGCVLFNYFVLMPEHSNLTTSMQPNE